MTPEIEIRIERIKSAFEQVAQRLANERVKNAELQVLYEQSLESNKQLLDELTASKLEVQETKQQLVALSETIQQQSVLQQTEKEQAIDELVREIEDCIRHLKK